MKFTVQSEGDSLSHLPGQILASREEVVDLGWICSLLRQDHGLALGLVATVSFWSEIFE